MYGRLQQNNFNSNNHHQGFISNHNNNNNNNSKNYHSSNAYSNSLVYSSNYLQQSQFEPRHSQINNNNITTNNNGSFYQSGSLLGPIPNDSSIQHGLIQSSRNGMQQSKLGNSNVLTLSPSIQTSISNFHANSLLNNNNNNTNGVNGNRLGQNGSLVSISSRLSFNGNTVNSSPSQSSSSTSLLGNPNMPQAISNNNNALNNRNNNNNGKNKAFSGKIKNGSNGTNQNQTPRFNPKTNNNNNNKNKNEIKPTKKETENVNGKTDENAGEKPSKPLAPTTTVATKIDTTSDAYIQKLKTCIDANRRNINQRLNSNNKNQVSDKAGATTLANKNTNQVNILKTENQTPSLNADNHLDSKDLTSDNINGEGDQQKSDQTNDPQAIKAAKAEENTLDAKNTNKRLNSSVEPEDENNETTKKLRSSSVTQNNSLDSDEQIKKEFPFIVKLSGVLSEFVDDTNAKEVNKSLFKVDVKVYYCKVCCSMISEVKYIYSHIETELHKAKLNEQKMNVSIDSIEKMEIKTDDSSKLNVSETKPATQQSGASILAEKTRANSLRQKQAVSK